METFIQKDDSLAIATLISVKIILRETEIDAEELNQLEPELWVGF